MVQSASKRLIDAAALPGAAERIAQADAAREVLARFGYEAIGLDHFAHADDPMAIATRDGTLRRNFQGYTTDGADCLIGLGASSIGQTPSGYMQNAPDVGNWRRAVEEGRMPIVKGVAISEDDRLRAAAIERLMCDFALDYGSIAQRLTGRLDALDDAEEALVRLASDGVLTRQGRTIVLTEAGKPFVRLAAAAFDAYLERQNARHSVAV